MKTISIALVLVAVNLSAFGQGKVALVNDSFHLFVLGATMPADGGLGGGTQFPGGGTTGGIPASPLPSGKTLTAILYAGTNLNNMKLQASQPLTNAFVAGRMPSRNVILTGVPGGTVVNFQVFLTDTDATLPASIIGGTVTTFSGASYFGTSGTFTAVPGSSITYPGLLPQGGAASSTWPTGNVVINALAGTPPLVVTNPLSRMVGIGGNVTFSAAFTGPNPQTYQWRKDGSPISGATSISYSISGVTTNDAGAYDVFASNYYGSTNTVAAILTVGYPPTIDTAPATQTIASGNPAVFTVAASGSAPLTYQWRANGADVAGATDTAYTIDPALTNHSGAYSVVIANAFGSITSAPANLTVFIPVSLTSSPADQIAAAGGSATFSAGATGFPLPTYQWRFKGAVISGATSDTLEVLNINLNKLGAYSVAVANPYSAVTSSPAQLYMSPSISDPFRGVTATLGTESTLSVGAIGSGTLAYQWYKNGVAVSGATSSTLVFTSTQLSDAGLYGVVITSSYGSSSNSPAQLVVNPANVLLGSYAGLTIEGAVGNTYGIESTTNYADASSWQYVTNITLTAPSQLWLDTSVNVQAPGVVRRLYRVVSQ